MRKGKGAPNSKETKPKVETRRPHPHQEKAKFEQKPEKAGLLVTAELNNALEECKAKVARISKECRAKNRKFRCASLRIYAYRPRISHPPLQGISSSISRTTVKDVFRVLIGTSSTATTLQTCSESHKFSIIPNSSSTGQNQMI